jgi:hypothetical protein
MTTLAFGSLRAASPLARRGGGRPPTAAFAQTGLIPRFLGGSASSGRAR